MSYQLTLHDCIGSASKQRRVASDSAARRPPISPLILQVHDDQSEEDAKDATHLSLPTSTCSPSPSQFYPMYQAVVQMIMKVHHQFLALVV